MKKPTEAQIMGMCNWIGHCRTSEEGVRATLEGGEVQTLDYVLQKGYAHVLEEDNLLRLTQKGKYLILGGAGLRTKIN